MRSRTQPRYLGWIALLLLAGLPAACRPAERGAPVVPEEPVAAGLPGEGTAPQAPETLLATGLYRDASMDALADGVRPYAPRYPLWTDGARKRRWVLLPEGAAIDARDPSAWRFPVGTKLWKEFSFERRVETRYLERTAQGWIRASYVWSPDGREARLAPAEGLRGASGTGFGTRHDVPSLTDCGACHDASQSGVLGFDAVQLGPERDPLAPHAETPEPGALDLDALLAEGRLVGSPAALRTAGAPIAGRSPRERAALGYLHANCGGCHNDRGPLASLGLDLSYRPGAASPALATALGRPSRYLPTGWSEALRIAPGTPERSVLVERMASRFGALQMPPLGTHAPDAEALELLRAWIRLDLACGAERPHADSDQPETSTPSEP